MAQPETPTLPRGTWSFVRAWLWPALKGVLVLAVVGAVGWQFASILREPALWAHPLRPHPLWLAVAAGLYLAGLALPAFFWYRLLRVLGQQPRGLATLRAYYVGQIGRYIPGKVVGLGLRARLLTGPGVQGGAAVLTVVYETLTTNTSGVLLGVLLFAVWTPFNGVLLWRCLGLLAVLGVLLLPGVFNRLVARMTGPFRRANAPPLAPVRASTLLVGLGVTGLGWLAQGGVLWAVCQALVPEAWADPLEGWVRCTAYTGLAYAAGFLVLAAPGGLGVRDFLIQRFLAADLGHTLGAQQAATTAVLAAVLLRLLWIVVDMSAAGVAYWLPAQDHGARAKHDTCTRNGVERVSVVPGATSSQLPR
jgi:hypothetical protein